jgi:PAS domain-containing protein
VQSRWLAQCDTQGNVAELLESNVDITERKQTERVLQRHNERLSLLSEAAAHLLAAKDPTAMVRELFGKVCAHLNVHAYFNFMVNEAGDALRLDSFTGIPERAAHLLERLEFKLIKSFKTFESLHLP